MTVDSTSSGDGRTEQPVSGWDDSSQRTTRDALLRFARNLLCRWPRLACRVTADDLVNDVLMHEWQRSGMKGAPLPALNYLKDSVRNRANSLFRKLKRTELIVDGQRIAFEGMPRPHDAPPAGRDQHLLGKHMTIDPREEEVDPKSLKKTMSALRVVLDRSAERPRGREVVNFHAVALLQLRTALAARFGRVVAEAEQGVSEFVEEVLPWSAAERASVLRPGWPTLDKIWDACRSDLDAPPHRVGAEMLGRRIGELRGGADPLGSDAWYKWLQRAKEKLREVATPQEWEELLEPLLPQRGEESAP